jgi:predicted DNA-binding transcriptional regulator YafY
MSKKSYILRYFLIIHKLRRTGQATFKEILAYLKQESDFYGLDDLHISKRTFDRDRDEISSLFHIDIDYDPKTGAYRIDSQKDMEINQHFLEAFDLFNTLNVATDLTQILQLEKRRPAGVENLYGLIHAIKNRLIISFSYLKFWEEEPTDRTLEPYAIKEFKGRWYVIGKETESLQIKTFGLERMKELEISNKHFTYPLEFNVKTHFKDSYGIINPDDEEAEEVILSLTPDQGKYTKSLPLHKSQKVIIDNDEEVRIRLKIKLTYDLLMELLSYGESLTVISPDKLKDWVVGSLKGALKNYR